MGALCDQPAHFPALFCHGGLRYERILELRVYPKPYRSPEPTLNLEQQDSLKNSQHSSVSAASHAARSGQRAGVELLAGDKGIGADASVWGR